MTVYFARKEYVYSGGDAIFSIPFSYIKKEHISVLVNDEATENYTYLNNSQIQVNDTLETNDVVSIIRSTPIDSRMVVFSDTSILDKKAQNLAQEQVFDAIQEVYDNNIKFNIDTLDILEANKEELEQTIANNKQELLDIQSSFESEVTQTIADNKQELEGEIQDFENEVNTTIETVTEAAEKVNNLEQAVEEAKTAAQTATSKADETSQTLDDAITEMDNRITAAATSMNQKLANAQQAVENATQQANLATQKAQEIFDINPANTNLSNLTEAGLKVIKDNSGSGLEICDIGMALYVDETKGLRRYLNGQVVDINTNTQAFLNRLKEITTLHPSLLCTEEEWQTAKTMSAFGQVGKFVFNYSGDEIVSVRIPRVVNVQGLFDLQNLGMTVSAGLPNITGTVPISTDSNVTGAFKIEPNPSVFTFSATGNGNNLCLDSSLSNPIYGNSDTVQQEAVQYPYFIQVATGSETENNIINEIELNNPYSLFDSKYSDHELNNLSWLKSEGQWNAKAVYTDAYDKLLKVYNGTETVEGLSVKLSTEEYTDYDFVLNTADETFRLPLKTKLASGKAVVGNGMTLGLTNGRQNAGLQAGGSDAINLVEGVTTNYGTPIGSSRVSGGLPLDWNLSVGITTDPTKSGIELSDSGLYLFFYVGETVQNANLIDAGRIGEQLANKVDVSNTQWATNACMPDYSAGVAVSTGVYTPPLDGYLYIRQTGNSGKKATVYIGENTSGQFIYSLGNSTEWESEKTGTLLLHKNQTYYIDGSATSITFYPLKGAK